MASLQRKGEGWYCQFMYQHRRHTFTIGRVDEDEAQAVAAKVDYLLMRIKQRLMTVPAGMDIVTFIRHDGQPPAPVAAQPGKFTLADLRESYTETFGGGAIEANTLSTAKIHFKHLVATFGDSFPLHTLTLAELQRHVDRRRKKVVAVTIKKEIDTFRAAWRWAARMGKLSGTFPNSGLVYPKADEKLPFMTWSEIKRRIMAGGDAARLWECLFLTPPEIEELLTFVHGRGDGQWVYPAILLAAHTGARRSEMIRARVEDVDLSGGTLTIREKKRTRGTRTTRRVPISPQLAGVLAEWLPGRNGLYLFGPHDRPMCPQAADDAIKRVLKGSKWAVLKGWHVLRHSFISALAAQGIDQRIIDEFVGHQTEAQRRRYRHLTPDVTRAAINAVFGPAAAPRAGTAATPRD